MTASSAKSQRTRRSELCLSVAEERANTISHGIGVGLSFIALAVMVYLATPFSPWHMVSVSIFGSSLAVLYLSSTIYHAVSSHGKKKFFQILDHSFIYVLIAGSYTPWLLVNLRGPWGWSLFGIVWGLALSGIVLKAIFLPRFEKLGTAMYVAMGWVVCVAIKPLLENITLLGLIWLVAGGLFYTVGVVFFLLDKKIRFAHLVWHLFVLAGSFCHVMAVIFGVLTHEPGIQ